MNNRLLYIGNIAGKRMTGSFSGTAIAAAHDLDMDVICVANRSKANENDIKLDEEKWGVRLLHIDLARSPYRFLQNYKAYKQLIKIIKDYDIKFIHCNTPVGGMLGRLAGRKCKVTKVIYQAHGFHFFKGAPLINNTLIKWIELIMARWTDAVITMNEEDYQATQKFRLKENGKVFKVHGVGVDLKEFENVHVTFKEKRAELGIKPSDIVCISAGDLVKRKNYGTAIKAVANIKDINIHYLICGDGPEEEKLKEIAIENGVADNVHFLGFRKDVKELMMISDIFLFTTLQEGLPRSMMEAMACGLPCVASRVRGNVDLLDDGKEGYLCSSRDDKEVAQRIKELGSDVELRQRMKLHNLEAIRDFDVSVVEREIEKIYKEILRER